MERFCFSFKNKTVEDIEVFAEKASQVDGDVSVISGKNHFDGSSFLGLLNLKDCDVLLVVYPYNAEDFRNYLLNNFVSRLPRLNSYI